MWQTPKNKEENKAQTLSRPALAQAKRPRVASRPDITHLNNKIKKIIINFI